MTMETLNEHGCWGGTQGFYEHESEVTGTTMRFAVFVPAAGADGPLPVLYFLSGLTCNEENATTKAGAQQHASRLGLILVMPDTSPRGAGIAGEDDDWDFGTGAGFYLDATQEPWSSSYRMESYVVNELRALVDGEFSTRAEKIGVVGHSMGGHGALTLALKHPNVYRSVSALSPIASPSRCPWGHKAFTRYLGEDRELWKLHDASELIRAGRRQGPILVDQGSADAFLEEQLLPHELEAACRETGQDLELRLQPGYDHSFYFVQTFIGDHLEHHAKFLTDEG